MLMPRSQQTPPRASATVAEERSMGKLRTLLADDHTIVRQGLRKILEAQPEWSVVAETGDGREAVRQTLVTAA